MNADGYLLDTGVVSEVAKPDPDRRVVGWFDAVDEDLVYPSVVTVAEMLSGINRMAEGRRRRRLEAWLEDDVMARFDERILGVDTRLAHSWADVLARGRAAGVTVNVMDGFTAATAAVHGSTLVTRNVRRFDRLGVRRLDPRDD